jgi:hypothetical protein
MDRSDAPEKQANSAVNRERRWNGDEVSEHPMIAGERDAPESGWNRRNLTV